MRSFLDLELPGSKVLVGHLPELGALKATYRSVHFTGSLLGPKLAAYYSRADMFVSSRTILSALLCWERSRAGCS